jgi:LCP family protein required for cell wall assembly
MLRTFGFALTILVILFVPFYFFARSRVVPIQSIVQTPSVKLPPALLATATPSIEDKVRSVGAVTEPIKDASPSAGQTPIALPTANVADSRYAFLLLGYGGGGHDGAYLTDSMMVVIVDPTRKTMTLLSLPRDSWVPLSFDGQTSVYQKINTAYAFAEDPTLYPDRLTKYAGAHGPGTLASDTVSNLLGIPISYYLSLDFQGFRDMINAVGGVDVDVPTGFAALYPANDDPSIDPTWITVTFSRGMQHMTGERAIEYARARETIDDSGEGSDFARSRRQRLIIEAFKARLFQPGGFTQLPRLMGIASQHVDTNYTIPAVEGLSQLALDWKSVTIYQTALTIDNYLVEGTGPAGTYILVPGSPDHSWAQTRAFARRLWQDPAAGAAMASTQIIVENDSGISGLGTRIGDDLAALGYKIGPPQDGSVRSTTHLLDQTSGAALPLEHQLGTDLGLGTLDVSADATSSNELILQLGQDAADVRITVPDDALAPSSTVGVEVFGTWVSQPATSPAVDAVIIRTVTAGSPVELTAVATAAATAAADRGTFPVATPRSLPRATPIAVANDAGFVIVPDLVGLLEADAQKVIGDSELMTTYVNYQVESDVADKAFFLSIPPGGVLSQHPVAGTRVSRGTKVSLAVRKT